jgi:hypothetical protein
MLASFRQRCFCDTGEMMPASLLECRSDDARKIMPALLSQHRFHDAGETTYG